MAAMRWNLTELYGTEQRNKASRFQHWRTEWNAMERYGTQRQYFVNRRSEHTG
jgi:hypothetical protein